MSISEVLKDYSSYKTYDKDLIISALAGCLDSDGCTESKRLDALKAIHTSVMGCHFNQFFANRAISKMRYTDSSGSIHTGPFVSEEEVKIDYEVMKRSIPQYNFWDFLVTVNMMASDYGELLERWFGVMDKSKCEELAMSYLLDEDSNHKDCKIWCYLCS